MHILWSIEMEILLWHVAILESGNWVCGVLVRGMRLRDNNIFFFLQFVGFCDFVGMSFFLGLSSSGGQRKSVSMISIELYENMKDQYPTVARQVL